MPQKLQQLREELQRFKALRDLHEKRLKLLDIKIRELEEDGQDLLETLEFGQLCAQTVKRNLSERFSDLITEGLRFIFEEPYTFETTIEVSRGYPSATFTLVLPNGARLDPLNAQGGGVVDVLSLLLRLVFLGLRVPNAPLLLDEPLKHLSQNYFKRALSFLDEYSRETGRQIIMVSHKEVTTGRRLRVVREGSRSIVVEEES